MTQLQIKKIIALVMVTILALLVDITGIYRPIDHFLRDLRYRSIDQAVSEKFVIVAIDPQSIKEVGQWPWPRRVHAKLIDEMLNYNVDEIALDIDLSQPSNAVDDQLLAGALERAGGFTYLASFNQLVRQRDGSTTLAPALPLAQFREHGEPVVVNVRPGEDGKIRRIDSGARVANQNLKSLPLAITQFMEPEIEPSIIVNYGLDLSQIDIIPAIDLIQRRVAPERLEGKSVLVGATAVELGDVVLVPKYGHIPGVALLTLAAESRLTGNRIYPMGGLPTILVIFGFILFFVVRGRPIPVPGMLFVYGSSILLVESVAFFAQSEANVLFNTTAAHGVMVGYILFFMFNELQTRRTALETASIENVRMQAILDRVVEDNFDGVIIIDGREKILLASVPAQELLQAGQSLAGKNAQVLPGVLYKEAVRLLRGKVVEGIPSKVSNLHVFEQGIHADKGYVGKPVALEYSITVSRIDRGHGIVEQVACLTFRDVTERLNHENRLSYLANYDGLTGAFTRQKLVSELDQYCRPRSDKPRHMTLLLLDLDRFKNINDTLGIGIGDQLLKQVAKRLSNLGLYSVTRLGGDRFAAVYPQLLTEEEIAPFANSVLVAIVAPYTIGAHRALIGASLGMTDTENSGHEAENLLTHADMAHSEAKSMPGNSFFAYRSELSARVRDRQAIEVALLDAVVNKQLFVQYQPQVDLASNKIIGAESLVRWRHPDLGFVRPDRFISVAENSGMIIEIGRWVLLQSCIDAAKSATTGRIAVNVSAVQFEYGDVLADIDYALKESGLAPSRLDIEITESVFVSKQDKTIGILDSIIERGVGIALDDFGTGYSSLSYLSKLPVNKIKIDKAFVRHLPEDKQSMAIINAVVSLSKHMDKKIVAEGIETEEQARLLHRAGCHIGQGYLFGKPLDREEFCTLLENYNAVAEKDAV
ncbi:EAL domain-containing protein [Maritalea mediterranea]|uniref:EAL domain-containing protein n=1 Tax=Maritalea mediterranea TaxID=2909667 RepID=A0ABS9E7J8_9HYPH|nr:EAL domain-containing protein [Maritalea mediterranea]MCF4098858.1 EAL domain-containing protein [Maritalea mediterranea]